MRIAGLGLLVLLGVGLSGLPRAIGGALPWTVELLALLLGVPLLLERVRRASGIARDGRVFRAAALLVALTALGHVARDKRAYPFMPFTMYGRAREGDIAYYEYRARPRSGEARTWKPSSLIATLEGGRLMKGLTRHLDAMRAAPSGSPARQGERALVERTLRVLARIDNRDERDPIAALEVYRVVIAPPYPSASARRELLLRVPLEGAR